MKQTEQLAFAKNVAKAIIVQPHSSTLLNKLYWIGPIGMGPTVEVFLSTLQSYERDEADKLVTVLKRHRHLVENEVVETLVERLGQADHDAETAGIINALGELLPLVENPDRKLWVANKATLALIPYLWHDSFTVQEHARQALYKIEEAVVGPVCKALQDAHIDNDFDRIHSLLKFIDSLFSFEYHDGNEITSLSNKFYNSAEERKSSLTSKDKRVLAKTLVLINERTEFGYENAYGPTAYAAPDAYKLLLNSLQKLGQDALKEMLGR